MKDLINNVAVVTGAASGIGFALCAQFASAKMKIVLSDINPDVLKEAEQKIQKMGVETHSVVADVSQQQDVSRLATETLERFGSVHVLCNNAGIFGRAAYLWEQSNADWEKGMNINFWGVINGIRVFTPIMLKQDTEAHIINTASVAGHLVQPFLGPYQASKFAVAAITESLFHELDLMKSKIGVTLLCPGFTKTNILNNKSEEDMKSDLSDSARMDFVQAAMEAGVEGGLTSEEVAAQTLSAIKEKRFYVFPNTHTLDMIKVRFEGVLNQQNPDLGDEVKQRFDVK